MKIRSGLQIQRLFPSAITLLAGSLGVWGWIIGLPEAQSLAYMPDVNSPNEIITETLKLTAQDGDFNDQFGDALAVDEDTLVVGALEDNEGGINAGAVYIFEQISSTPISWTFSIKLVVSDSVPLANFGASIAIEGDILVVGAPNDNGERGSVYIFARNSGGTNQWGQIMKLSVEEGDPGDYFGVSIALSGTILAVGADGDDERGNDAGAVYIFDRNQGGAENWGLVKKTFHSVTDAIDHFGTSVGLDGDTLAVGAPFDDPVASDSGSVTVFQRDQGGPDNWGQVRLVVQNDAATLDYFGTSLTILDDTLAVGAIGEDTTGANSGAVYIFSRDQGGNDVWGQTKKLFAQDGLSSQQYGTSLQLFESLLVVGRPQNNFLQVGNGVAYLYGYQQGGSGNWGEITQLLASDSESMDAFGSSVAINSNGIFVGAKTDNNKADDSGSAYIFQMPDIPSIIYLPIVRR